MCNIFIAVNSSQAICFAQFSHWNKEEFPSSGFCNLQSSWQSEEKLSGCPTHNSSLSFLSLQTYKSAFILLERQWTDCSRYRCLQFVLCTGCIVYIVYPTELSSSYKTPRVHNHNVLSQRYSNISLWENKTSLFSEFITAKSDRI